MVRYLSASSAVALLIGAGLVGLGTPAQAQTSSTVTSEYDTSVSAPGPTVAQAPVRTEYTSDGSNFAVRPGPYLRFDTGHSWATNRSVDDSWIVGGGAGWRFSPNLRADITFDYRPDFNQTSNFGIGPGPHSGLQNWTLMANGYYDFTLDAIQPLVPYVGAGFGFARNSVDGITVAVPGTGAANLTGRDTNQFAWQVSAGVSYNFSPNMALDVGYRYLSAGETGFGGRLHANELSTSLRFGF